MKNNLVILFMACTLLCSESSAQVKNKKLKYPGVHLIGVGYSYFSHNIVGEDGMTYSYRLLSKRMQGASINYLWQPRIIGLSAQLDFVPYKYRHSTYRDPRHGYSSVTWSEHSDYSVYRLAFTPGVSLATRGEKIRAVLRVGPEISGNIGGKGTFTRTQISVLYDTSGNRYRDTSIFIKGIDDWERDAHVNASFQFGVLGKVNSRFYYSVMFRVVTGLNYNFIPTRSHYRNLTKSLSFSFHYCFGSGPARGPDQLTLKKNRKN